MHYYSAYEHQIHNRNGDWRPVFCDDVFIAPIQRTDEREFTRTIGVQHANAFPPPSKLILVFIAGIGFFKEIEQQRESAEFLLS